MKMRKQRFMGVILVVISWLIFLLAWAGGEDSEDRDATAALITGSLGVYMLCADTCVLYDSEPKPKARDSPEASPCAPLSPGSALPHPLYPYESPFYEQLYREELEHGKKTSDRGTES